MHTNFKRLAGTTAACVICAGAPAVVGVASADAAALKTAPSGTSLVATTPTGGVNITLSRDGRQVRTALFAYKQSCNDGDVVFDYDRYAAIPIGANRKFSFQYQSQPQPSPTTPGATFSYTMSFTGMVNKARTRIIGTARSTFAFMNPAGASFSCDTGTVAFKATD